MAIYRHVHVSFWQDSFVLDLTPEEKYFYLYLMTNSKTTQCGIYELPKRIMETETGYNRETVEKLLKRFIDYGKIDYNENTKEIVLRNWAKYNSSNSPKVKACIDKELKEVKHTPFIQYLYSIDSLDKDLGEKEKEKEKEKTNTVQAAVVQDMTEQEKISLETLRGVAGYKFDQKTDLAYIRKLVSKYPAIDVHKVIDDWAINKIETPLEKKSNARSQINTWCSKRVERMPQQPKSPVVKNAQQTLELLDQIERGGKDAALRGVSGTGDSWIDSE